ncbi:MAG: hypothetical protein M1819_000212 [Sarea resinae]|nr:MAG: hypothetical protein M1819_000212 [Sarea resinae]
MARQEPFYLFKETRLTLEPTSSRSTIFIRLTARDGSNQSSRPNTKRSNVSDLTHAEDEAAFGRKHIATEASIYFRQNKSYPRSFLWRILEDGKVLELQSADVNKAEREKPDATLRLRLGFPTALRPSGVALADTTEHDILTVFALTTNNDLYTLTLRPRFFSDPAALEGNTTGWCKSFQPSSFSFRYPHRLIANSPLELLVSLHDGGLLRLTRKAGDDGSSWRETFFTEGGWGSSLRGFIPWKGHNTIRYGNIDLEQTTVTSIALSPDDSHVFTVCLNHTLKAWNLSTGKIGVVRDLLNEERQPRDISKYLMDPTQSKLLQVFSAEGAKSGDLYYVVTYSPFDVGQFKFWAVRDADNSELGMYDMFPSVCLRPPEPYYSDSEIWSMHEFRIKSAPGGKGMQLWILWKNNTTYQVQSLAFDLLALPGAWTTSWVAMACESLRNAPKPVPTDLGSTDATDQWIDYFFSHGRFTEATLATSLSLYLQNLSSERNALVRKGKTLKERICLAVASTVVLGQDPETIFCDQYRAETHAQWDRFYYLVVELDKRRSEATSLAYDDYADMPWVINADGAVAIRECSDTELLWHNRKTMARYQAHLDEKTPYRQLPGKRHKEPAAVAGLLQAAKVFREGFSPALSHSCTLVLDSEILQDSSYSVPARIQSFYDRCNFVGQISDDDYNKLMDAIEHIGGLQTLDNDLFLSIFDTISQKQWATDHRIASSDFGAGVLVRGAQETIHLVMDILLDLLVMVVFVEIEIDKEEEPLENFDAPRIYVRLLRLLKQYEVLRWLSQTTRTESDNEDKENSRQVEIEPSQPAQKTMTLLQSIFITFWRSPVVTGVPYYSLLTYSCRCWISNIELVDAYDDVVTRIMCNLLHKNEINLATDFLRFLPDTAWSTYVKGRFHLSCMEYAMAAVCFKRAAFTLARGKHSGVGTDESEGLLDLDDLGYFRDGLPRYYLHILGLFEKARAHSFVADFARLALQFLSLQSPGLNGARRNSNDSDQLQTEVLSRLFYASIQACRFDEAYSALSRYTDTALQKSATATLVQSLTTSNHTHLLSQFPYNPRIDIDAALAALAATHSHAFPIIPKSSTTGGAAADKDSNNKNYHTLLASYRLSRQDFRGAATALWEWLQSLLPTSASSTPSSSSYPKHAHGRDSHSHNDYDDDDGDDSDDGDDEDATAAKNETIARAYLALINVLSCVGEPQAFILASVPAPSTSTSTSISTDKRTIVTLHDIRNAYQRELDRVSDLQGGRFAFSRFSSSSVIAGGGAQGGGGADAMDVF